MFTLFLILDSPLVGFYIYYTNVLSKNVKEAEEETPSLNTVVAGLKDVANNISLVV